MLSRNKRGGFKAFVRRRDGKPPAPKFNPSELAKVTHISRKYLGRVIQGNTSNLMNAFSWSSTPQGGIYWNDRDMGSIPLSPEDYQWLQELYDYHVNLQQG